MHNNLSNDEDDQEDFDLSNFKVDWLDLQFAGSQQKLGICGLPGCRFKDRWRSLVHDIECLKQEGVQDVFCLCTKGEFYLYRTQDILEKYCDAGFTVHHYPIDDGQIPAFVDLIKIIEDLQATVSAGKRTIIHCFGGLGRSCVVAACLMMVMNDSLAHDDVARKLKELRGNGAIQSIKQYNLVTEFRDLLIKHKENADAERQNLSR
ncbi:unnamed protein product [Lymnaea stagnalis]|uniref:protein-tyrosine-phosphatase n=1 Tax=Lymnaea stagnalis TaxID=6523 RepID=A0AAV2HZY1_LYMST